MFPQKSTTVKQQEQTQANVDLNTALLGMNVDSPESDDYNKYIIISDPIRNNAALESSTSLEDINKNIAKFTAVAEAAKASKITSEATTEKIISAYANQKTKTLFVENMIQFL